MLRQRLRTDRELSPFEKREVAQAVFAYFRWLGWMNPRQGVETQVLEALELAAAFKRDPAFISEQDLHTRAVPEWVHEYARLTPEILRQFQSEPPVWLRVRSELVDQVQAGLPEAVQHPQLGTAFHYQGEEDLFRTDLFQNGAFELQDISSQWVGWFTAAKPGSIWWDACAGEGGKMLHLSDLMQNKGLIWATDPAEWRLDRLKKRASRAKVYNFRSRLWKADQPLPFKTKFDGILVDAPCSGIGTWQRNPQARWTSRPEDVKELAAIQKQLLEKVQALLKPGALLVYSVCTLAEMETTSVAESFSSNFNEFEPASETFTLFRGAVAESKTSGNEAWMLPHQVNGNGMYCAVWKRKTSS